MTDKPEHPEGPTNEQDQSLEAQLDALLDDLETTEPEMVPEDLRKHAHDLPASEPVAEEAVETEQPTAIAKQGMGENASMASNMLDKQIEDTIAAAKQEDEAGPPPVEPDAVAADGPGKRGDKSMDVETIESMASNVLDDQIQIMVDEVAKKRDTEAVKQSQATESVEAASAASEDTDADLVEKEESASEDALGGQIQALLDHVQSQPDFGETESIEPAETAAGPEDPRGEISAAEQASVEPAPEAEPDKTASPEAGAVSIEQIDAMLAESAEKAIEQEPEPVAEVPGTDEILAAQALEEDAQNQVEAQPVVPPQAEHEVPEPEPEPQPAAAVPQPAGATAADVADELDEGNTPAPAPAIENQPVYDDALEPAAAAVAIQQSALKKAEKTLIRICGKINRPLNRLSPEMKDTVGYVGIVVLLPALCLILYGLVF